MDKNKLIEFLKAETAEERSKILNTIAPEEQFEFLMTSKQILAELAVKNGASMRNACVKCKHRKNIPGDCHSRCNNQLAVAIGDNHGIENGWFLHPFNFDPVWLLYCDSFEEMT